MSTDSYVQPSAPVRRHDLWRDQSLRMLAGRLNGVLRVCRLLVLLVRLWVIARLRPPQAAAQLKRAVPRWAQRLLDSLQIEVRASGHVPAPDSAVLVVANHVSWLDSYALNTRTAARFVAKSEVRTWPLVGAIADGFGTVFIKRGCPRAAARTVSQLANLLADGHPVAGFPEGTTSDGSGILQFYPAMFQAAVRSGARVQPVAIRYHDRDGRPTNAANFVGDMSVFDSLRAILREPRLTAELVFCAPLDPSGRTRRELAGLARAAIAAALGRGDDVLGTSPLRRAA